MNKVPAPINAAPDLPRYLTVDQTAARLGYSRQTISLFIEEGRLPAVDIALEPGKTRALLRIPEDAAVAPRIAVSRF